MDNGGGIVGMIVPLIIMAVMIAALWKVFVKAGQPGWASIVPIYNIVVLVQISGKPVWWVILFFIPLANFVAAILISIAIAERFGKSTGYGLGLAFLGFMFYPMLGFSDAQYQG